MASQRIAGKVRQDFTWVLVGLILYGLIDSMSFAQDGTWTKKADMPTARSGLSTSAVGRKIYAIGGDGKGVAGFCLSTVEEYDTGLEVPENAWDVNGDRVVDQWDIAIVADYFGQDMPVECSYNPDVNRDGIIDIVDLVLVAIHYGEAYRR